MRVGRKQLVLGAAGRRLLQAERREALLLEELEEDLEFAEDWACSAPLPERKQPEPDRP
ncbi:hypothetical protein ACTHPH_00405 [Paenibacillus pasadenensis]|uniref:Uncharacterized protein n=1 Tax=Paenibacillus pasadenensis TaxID=217090 RepID=A0A2N5N9D2_9BACL|nr:MULTISPECIES: hypothetical protein [Paenibacillus]PLT46890.1 hypothetical protein B8V81_1114 [Paenibacillus pasadenensis]QGG57235.1 hypothetical protein GE073_17675 [Paenibacillus sp. B01]